MTLPSTNDQTVGTVTQGRRWWQVCCLGCSLIIVFFVIIGAVLTRVMTGPPMRMLSTLPDQFPVGITPFHLSEARGIRYAPGKSKGAAMGMFSLPLRFMGSVIGFGSPDQKESTQIFSQAVDGYSAQLTSMETVTIVWQPLRARKEEVLNYYMQVFQKNAMTVQRENREQVRTDFILATGPGVAVQLELMDDPATPDVDNLVMTVDYSAQK